jgi:hypothetical protein
VIRIAVESQEDALARYRCRAWLTPSLLVYALERHAEDKAMRAMSLREVTLLVVRSVFD